MINLKQLITEGKVIKLPFRKVLPGGIDAGFEALFSVYAHDSRIALIPKSSKELDKLDTLDFHREDIGVLIKNRLNDQFKEVKFNYDKNYQGAGYGFTIDMHSIIKKLK